MTDPLWPWIEANPTLLALVTFAAGLLIAGVAARFGSASMKDVLEQRESWPKLIADYRSGPAEAYFTAIDRTLATATRIWGPRPLSHGAFARCLQIAYLYPLAALLLGWLLFDLREVGGLLLFPETAVFWDRLWRVFVMVFGWAIAGFFLRRLGKYGGSGLPHGVSFLEHGGHRDFLLILSFFAMANLLKLLIFLVPWTAIYLVAFWVSAQSPQVIVALVFCGAFSMAGAFSGPLTLIGVGMAVFSVAVFQSSIEPATYWLLLFLILPFLNALADMASLAITRGFLGNVAHRRPSLWRVLGQLVLDLIFAALCLAFLVAGIIAALELVDWLTPYPLTFSWRGYWAAMQAAPSSGTALYLMAVTTLIPTFAHVVVGLGAIVTQKSQLLAPVADLLEEKLNDGTALLRYDQREVLRAVFRAEMAGYFIAFLLTVLGALALWHAGWWTIGALGLT